VFIEINSLACLNCFFNLVVTKVDVDRLIDKITILIVNIFDSIVSKTLFYSSMIPFTKL
jgi:hypothetical protein